MTDDVCIDEFNRKLAKRVAIKSEVIWAGQEEPFRLFGVSEKVWFIAAGMAALSWVALLIQGH